MPQIKSFQVDSTIITEEDLGVRVQDYNPEIVTVKNEFAGAVAPSTSDDSAAGFEVGSRWIDVATNNEYVCSDATASNAVWIKTTNTSVGIDDNSNTIAMTITVDENVGIGETVPLGRLHVKTSDSGAGVSNIADEVVLEGSASCGMSILSGTSFIGSVLFGDSGSATAGRIYYEHSIDTMSFWSNNTQRLTIDSSGDVGIATTTPDFKLEVHGTLFGGVTLATAHNTNNGVVLEYDTVSGDDMVTACAIGNNNRNLELRALSAGTPNNNQLYLHGANNTVGIGTSSHDGTLHVFSGSAGSVDASVSANELVLENSDHSGMHILCPDLKQGIIYFGTPSRQLGGLIAWDYTANEFTIGANNAAASTVINSSNAVEAIRIDGSQNVGIGIATPDGRLHAHASSAGTVTAHVNANTIVAETALSNGISILVPDGSSSLIMFGSPSSNRGAEIQWVYNSSSFLVTTRKVGAELKLGSGNAITAITIDSAQNVGIGTSSTETWSATHTALQIGGNSSIFSETAAGAAGAIRISQNAYNDGTWKYQDTDEASTYYQKDGRHIFWVAPSGTADAAITWTTAMAIENTGAITTPGSFENGAMGSYSASHSVPTATDVDIAWKESTTLLNTAYVYRFKLVTTGTGVDSGASYIVWYNDVSTLWEFRLISRAGSGSNHPALKINVAGDTAQVYHAHGSLYNIQIVSEYFYLIETDSQPHVFGADYMWQRDVNTLYYNDGDVGIGETVPLAKLHVKTSDSTVVAISSAANELLLEASNACGMTIISGTAEISSIMFGDKDVSSAGRLYYNNSTNDMSLWSSAIQRMTIQSTGSIAMVKTAVGAFVTVGHEFNVSGECRHTVDGGASLLLNRKTSDGILAGFYKDTVIYGNIAINATVTTYNTTSDYRLKENIVPITDGIDRIKLLNPSRFNFIDQVNTVDGFLAHEVQDIVPEASHGIKDEIDDDNNPVYQSMDASKLVPLLTAALKELNQTVEKLEARINILEGGN